MTTQFVEIAGQKYAMLPEEDYRRLVALTENSEDELAADIARARREAGEEYVPSEIVNQIIGGENALRVWREYRGLTQRELAEKAHIRLSTISEIENNRAQGKPKLWRALADALDVEIDEILPLN